MRGDSADRITVMPNSILATEIHEQPAAVARLLARERENARRLAAALFRADTHFALIAARGTSDNAARYAQYLFGARRRLPVALATPSLYTLYHAPPRLDGALVIAISQSGRSPDIVSVVQSARAQGRPTLAITNAPDSPLAQTADQVLPLHCGEERAVAATKTYTTSLAALALLAAALEDSAETWAQLEQAPAQMQATLDGLAAGLGRVERYTYIGRSAVIGRGFNYATAFEVALKVKELTHVTTEPYSSADFLHGPISVVQPGFPLLIIAPSGQTYADVAACAATAQARGADLIAISDNAGLLGRAQLPLPLPAGVPEWLSPLVAVLPGQLFALRLTEAKNLDADQPIGLTKVTETR
jgi:glucosamine--fructose-6-phosphate aminotransferase (isomerizing)